LFPHTLIWVRRSSLEILPDLDSNQDYNFQRVACYRYTIRE